MKNLSAAILLASPLSAYSAAITHNLNVEIIQVLNDSGGNPTSLMGSGSGSAGGSYIYETQVNEIWNQAGIQVSFTMSTWNNTEAQRVDPTELNSIFGNTFSSAGDSLPGIATDSLQIFFVMDHPGTGYTGATGSGWVGMPPITNPMTQGTSAGINQLFIEGTFSSNGRGVMASVGITSDSLSGVISHEIGHAIGLRHVEDVNGPEGAGTTQDPDFTIPTTEPNLMWGSGFGPNYNGGLNDDPNLTVLQENNFLNQQQIDAAIFNGLLLDPDGNGIGALQAIPEPSAIALLLLGLFPLARRRR